MLADELKRIRIEKKLHNKMQENNKSGAAEVIALLELITLIANKSKHVISGTVIIGCDNKKTCNKIVNKVIKTSTHAQEAGAEIAIIKRELKKIKFEVEIKHVKSHVKMSGTWRQQLFLHLIKEYDFKARETVEKSNKNERDTNMKYYGHYTLLENEHMTSRSMKEIIRIIDAKKK